MGKINKNIFSELTSKEKREVTLLIVGLHYFRNKKSLIKIAKKDLINKYGKENKITQKALSFRLEIVGEFECVGFDSHNTELLFFKKSETTEQKSLFEFEFNISDNILLLLLDAVKNNVNHELDVKDGNIKQILELSNLLERPFFFKFILGAGVSNQEDYNGLSWRNFEQEFKNVVADVFRDPELPDKMTENVFNVNYGIFQVVKDIEYDKYKEIMHNFIHSLKEPQYEDETTLSAVVDVIIKQSEQNNEIQQSVLTFNYDNLFESLYEIKSGAQYDVIHKMNYKYNTFSTKLLIKHPHGYLDKHDDEYFDFYFKSIVLTNDEYFDAYANPSSIGYKMLFEHLNETCCFVGNSITDYEEQKVLKKHFDMYPSSFHFAFLYAKSFTSPDVLYKTIFLLKIGVIPIWYKDHKDCRDILMAEINNVDIVE